MVLTLLKRVSIDTVDQRRTKVLARLGNSPAKTSVIAAGIGLPTETTRRVLEDLALLGFAYKTGSEESGYEWSRVYDYDSVFRRQIVQKREFEAAGLRLFLGEGHSVRAEVEGVDERTNTTPPENNTNQESDA